MENLDSSPAKPESPTPQSGETVNEQQKLIKDLSETAEANNHELEQQRRLEQAFDEHYAAMDSDYYGQENGRRAAEGIVQKSKYESDGHQIVTLASIKVNAEGKTIDGHDNDPASRNAHDIEAAFDQFISQVDRPIVVFEGNPRGPYESRDQAVVDATESGLIQHLAREKGIEAVSGEPSDQELMQGLVEMGYQPDQVQAYLLGRGLPSLLEKNPQAADDLGIHLYPKAAELGLPGYHDYSPQEKANIKKQGATERLFRDMNQQVQEYVQAINQLYSQDILVIDQAGTVRLRDDLRDQLRENKDMEDFWKGFALGRGNGGDLLRDSMRVRDKHIINTIDRLHRQGYDVISPYGGSHVVTQRPVLEALYGPPVDKNY